MATQQPSRLSQSGALLLGFQTFLRKEIHEWQRKQGAIALLVFLPIVFSALLVFFAKSTAPNQLPDLTLAASSYSNNPAWTVPVSVLLSIGLITQELDSGTLSWNLTKPLSRVSFLLGKWLSNTLVIWLFAIVIPNFVSVVISAIGLGWKTPNFGQILAFQVVGFCAVGFWVLLCLFLGVVLKDQASITTGALIVAALGSFLPLIPIEEIKPFAPFYPSNTLDWLVSENRFKLFAYLVYMAGMAIATKLIFDRKEFS
ncbi:MAG: ABC transporter permease subunit [Leptolyngbyaceae cyanobacterium SM1_3_5]|nr:ABC transporter permease subunit [Leptolyngbyaceae cyanobacterium SM1_3_5]